MNWFVKQYLNWKGAKMVNFLNGYVTYITASAAMLAGLSLVANELVKVVSGAGDFSIDNFKPGAETFWAGALAFGIGRKVQNLIHATNKANGG